MWVKAPFCRCNRDLLFIMWVYIINRWCIAPLDFLHNDLWLSQASFTEKTPEEKTRPVYNTPGVYGLVLVFRSANQTYHFIDIAVPVGPKGYLFINCHFTFTATAVRCGWSWWTLPSCVNSFGNWQYTGAVTDINGLFDRVDVSRPFPRMWAFLFTPRDRRLFWSTSQLVVYFSARVIDISSWEAGTFFTQPCCCDNDKLRQFLQNNSRVSFCCRCWCRVIFDSFHRLQCRPTYISSSQT